MTTHRLLIALLAAALLAPSALACSSDDDPVGNDLNVEDPNGDDGNDSEGNDEANASEPNNSTEPTNASEPEPEPEPEPESTYEHVLVDVSPTRFAYDVGATITPSATVYDDQWETVDIDVDWTVTPESAVEPDGDGKWTVQEKAEITFRACVVDEGEVTSVCGERKIIASDGMHSVIIERPLPGEHFDGSEDAVIPVEGVVVDELSGDAVQVNGQTVDVDDEGRFTHEVTPEFGINTITVRTSDGVNPNNDFAAVSVMWAPAYMAPEIDADDHRISSTIDEAIVLKLGQNFLDDGEPYTEIPEVQIITEDLADILHLVLEQIDIASQIPNPVVDSNALMLSIPDVIINDPVIELDSTDDGLELFGQIPDLHAETQGYIEFSDEVIDLDGSLSAKISLFASVDIDKAGADEPFHTDLVDFEIAVEGATPNFNSEEANAIFELADSVLRDNIEDILLEGIDLSFIETLPDMLLDILDSLEEIIDGYEIELDLGMGDPLTLSFDGAVEQFTPIRGEGLEGIVSAELSVDAEPHFPDTLGVPMLQAEDVASPFFSQGRVQLGIDLTMVNAIFHNLWNAGLLDLDITEMVPDNFASLIEEGHAEGLLPPVLAPPVGDEPHDLMLHLGQFEFALDWSDQQDRFGAAIVVGADVSIANEQVSIEISEEPDITLWLIETDEDEPLMSTAELHQLIDTFLWPEVEAMVGDSLAIALPLPELDALAEYAPALSTMTLNARMTRPMDVREGYLMLDAAIEGEWFFP